jgi:hypothetical protein
MKLFRNAGCHSILGQPIFDPLVIEDGSGTPAFLDFGHLEMENFCHVCESVLQLDIT